MQKNHFFFCAFLQIIFLYFISLCANSQTLQYTYDALGRVVNVGDPVNGDRVFNYDPAGNRTKVAAITTFVDAPTILPNGANFVGTKSVNLSTVTTGAFIYYTTNNTTPTTNSLLYTGTAFTLNDSAVVRAIAVKEGMRNSPESSAGFTLTQPAAPKLSPSGGAYVGSVPITLSSSNPNSSIYYTTNNTPPTSSSLIYTGSFTLTSSATIRAITVKSNLPNSSESTASFTIQHPPANPTGLQSRQLADCAWNASWNPVPGADIYYFRDNQNEQSTTATSISYSCPAGDAYSYRPIWVQACKSGACSSQINF